MSSAGFREFLRSKNGQYLGVALLTLGLAAVAYSVYSNVHSDTDDLVGNPVFMDSKTGQVFHAKLKPGMPFPIKGPSGADAYPPEGCYWTKDGKPKQEPTYVLLNTYKGLPEPTFCPECGRLVRPHNPMPTPGSKPPPTKEEYEARGH
jgi:hypothetical protein